MLVESTLPGNPSQPIIPTDPKNPILPKVFDFFVFVSWVPTV